MEDNIVTDSEDFRVEPAECLKDASKAKNKKRMKEIAIVALNNDGTHTVWSSCSYGKTVDLAKFVVEKL